MIFHATIAGKPGEEIACRVLDPAKMQWWQGDEAWGTDADALLAPLSQIGAQKHGGEVEYPYPGVVIEYLLWQTDDTWRCIGEDLIPAAAATVTLSEEDREEIAAAVAAEVNTGLTTPFVIPLVQGVPASLNLVHEKRFTLKRGDSFTLPLSLGRDCRGAVVRFAGKIDPKKDHYDMPLRPVTFTDPEAGTGYVELNSTDTATVATVFGEVEYRKDDKALTLESYTFHIREDIIK